jgi:hypothetical protein
MPAAFDDGKLEKRIPMTVAVHISEGPSAGCVETTFTEDVSSRGARVPSARPWKRNQTLNFESLAGDFRAVARVAYCRPHPDGYVIGLEFLEPNGRWVISAPNGSGKPLQG